VRLKDLRLLDLRLLALRLLDLRLRGGRQKTEDWRLRALD